MDGCFICAKHEGGSGVVSDDGVVFVGHTLPVRGPDALLGYLMVEPRRHVPGLGDLSDEEAARLGVAVNRVAAAMRSALGLEHVYSFVFGDSVPHLHVHLAPRYPGTPPEFRGAGAIGLQDWADGPRGAMPQIEAVCQRIRAAIPG